MLQWVPLPEIIILRRGGTQSACIAVTNFIPVTRHLRRSRESAKTMPFKVKWKNCVPTLSSSPRFIFIPFKEAIEASRAVFYCKIYAIILHTIVAYQLQERQLFDLKAARSFLDCSLCMMSPRKYRRGDIMDLIWDSGTYSYIWKIHTSRRALLARHVCNTWSRQLILTSNIISAQYSTQLGLRT